MLTLLRVLLTVAGVSAMRMMPYGAGPQYTQYNAFARAAMRGDQPGAAELTGSVVPSAAVSVLEKVETLRMELNLTKGASLVATLDNVAQELGLSGQLEGKNLAERADACIEMIGGGTTSVADDRQRSAAAMRRGDGYNSPYGVSPYRYGGFPFGYGYSLYGGSPYYGLSYPWAYSPYGGSGARRARLNERAIHDFYYDPYAAIGDSWDAYIDFFY